MANPVFATNKLATITLEIPILCHVRLPAAEVLVGWLFWV